MAIEARKLMDEFRSEAESFGVVDAIRRGIVHEQQLAPHEPHKLPPGRGAVYVFSLSEGWGSQCEAGPGFVLKVGKAGPNSNARFSSQHYNAGSAPSTLAERLLQHPEVWEPLGLSNPTKVSINSWLRARTDRDNFFIAGEDKQLLGAFETFLLIRLRPLFEG